MGIRPSIVDKALGAYVALIFAVIHGYCPSLSVKDANMVYKIRIQGLEGFMAQPVTVDLCSCHFGGI